MLNILIISGIQWTDWAVASCYRWKPTTAFPLCRDTKHTGCKHPIKVILILKSHWAYFFLLYLNLSFFFIFKSEAWNFIISRLDIAVAKGKVCLHLFSSNSCLGWSQPVVPRDYFGGIVFKLDVLIILRSKITCDYAWVSDRQLSSSCLLGVTSVNWSHWQIIGFTAQLSVLSKKVCTPTSAREFLLLFYLHLLLMCHTMSAANISWWHVVLGQNCSALTDTWYHGGYVLYIKLIAKLQTAGSYSSQDTKE